MSSVLGYIKKYPIAIISLVLGTKYSLIWYFNQNGNFWGNSSDGRIGFGFEQPYLSFPTRLVEEAVKKGKEK